MVNPDIPNVVGAGGDDDLVTVLETVSDADCKEYFTGLRDAFNIPVGSTERNRLEEIVDCRENCNKMSSDLRDECKKVHERVAEQLKKMGCPATVKAHKKRRKSCKKKKRTTCKRKKRCGC